MQHRDPSRELAWGERESAREERGEEGRGGGDAGSAASNNTRASVFFVFFCARARARVRAFGCGSVGVVCSRTARSLLQERTFLERAPVRRMWHAHAPGANPSDNRPWEACSDSPHACCVFNMISCIRIRPAAAHLSSLTRYTSPQPPPIRPYLPPSNSGVQIANAIVQPASTGVQPANTCVQNTHTGVPIVNTVLQIAHTSVQTA
eukprot:2575039-Rhodomonas_salina.1